MKTNQKIEKLRMLWTQILISGKLTVCSDELKDANILDVNILRTLFDNPNVIPKELAGLFKIPNSTLTNAINRLEKKGLLQRQLNTNDLRSLRLVLTVKGIQAISKHRDAESELIGNILSVLSAEESDTLVAIFDKMVNCL